MSAALPPLIDAPGLLTLLAAGDEDVLMLDARFNLMQPDAGEAAWRAGHIPGAAHAHLERDLSGPKTGTNGRHPLPSPHALAETLGRWGLTPATRVVAYDDAGGMFAARAWWLLRWAGHARVQVLDGGWSAWLAAGGAGGLRGPPRPPPPPPRRPRRPGGGAPVRGPGERGGPRPAPPRGGGGELMNGKAPG